ncbi:MAG: LOG family protein [Propionibacteriaceae bacterium]
MRKHPHPEIHSRSELENALTTPAGLRHTWVQSVDCRGITFAHVAARGAVFLGCDLDSDAFDILRDAGALIFPVLPQSPMDPYRPQLYSPRDLYDVTPYEASLDGQVYAWTLAADRPASLDHTLAAALHDHAMSDALDELELLADPQRMVGIMGGHALQRGSDDYAATARLARELARAGYVVCSGGGPGAMEAANLGACVADAADETLDQALAALATVPSFRPSIDAWASIAFEVLDNISKPHPSLGIPTWFYGHEPPNIFATHIAKYFSNAIREDTLLARCRGGIIFLPGAAGTVQELFQATTANYYAADPASTTPVILVGHEQWTTTLPAWPLLEALSKDRAMADSIFLAATVTDALPILQRG